jgi:hypothetical protein
MGCTKQLQKQNWHKLSKKDSLKFIEMKILDGLYGMRKRYRGKIVDLHFKNKDNQFHRRHLKYSNTFTSHQFFSTLKTLFDV